MAREHDPADDLATPEDGDEFFNWVYQHVHARYAEHWSTLYDSCPSKSVTLAIQLTYRAIVLAINNVPDEEEEAPAEEDDDES